ncbi:hypothetical protein [Microbulbifer taiwanensis]|uniref:hypothetical protein n=1 Tax=Microbulbifer taiwanensis TaxID=986746 RepID=UPI003622746E
MHRIIVALAALLLGQTVAAQTSYEKGRYLAAAADCVACHTAVNGRPFIGGRPFHTPFGTLYSTNITPDEKTGIGNYTLADFRASMHRGKGVHGNLYPAMPYTSYYLVSEEDIEALYDYFMQLPPVEYTAPRNQLMFPANLRFGLTFWNWIFFDREPLAQPQGKSPEWQRGNYLVNALGHCGECHTPRNFAQAMRRDRHFAGNLLEGWDAVDIRPRRCCDRVGTGSICDSCSPPAPAIAAPPSGKCSGSWSTASAIFPATISMQSSPICSTAVTKPRVSRASPSWPPSATPRDVRILSPTVPAVTAARDAA